MDILDLGVTHHMSHLLAQFISLNLNSSKSVMAANGDSMPLAGIGSVDTPYVALSDVYCILSLTMNLASINIHDTASSGVDLSSFLFDYSSSTFYLRLGHVCGSHLRFLASTGALKKLDAHDISDCTRCKLAEFSALPF
ncbi:hypothetical protein Tco_1540575 [Tanacetum coccineum]